MKIMIASVIFITGAFVFFGWSSVYGNGVERDKGYGHADQENRKDTADIKRTQGDGGDGSEIHSYIRVQS